MNPINQRQKKKPLTLDLDLSINNLYLWKPKSSQATKQFINNILEVLDIVYTEGKLISSPIWP